MAGMQSWQVWIWPLAWTVVFATNLIVPLKMAWEVTRQGGRVGMGCAVAGYWTLGLLASVRPGTLGRGLVVGGMLVGLSQLAPILQMFVGIVALDVWGKVSGQTETGYGGPPLSELGGFAVTAMTGGALLAAAGFCGMGIVAMSGWKPAAKSADETRA